MSSRVDLHLLDGAAAECLLRNRLASREWWAFVLIGRDGLDFVADLEERYFRSKAARDLTFVTLPFVAGLGKVSVLLARKRRLSVRELSRLLDANGAPHGAEALAGGDKDVIFLTPTREGAERAGQWLARLVGAPAANEAVFGA